MYYKFVWNKTKRKWEDKVPLVNEAVGLHYLVKNGDEVVIEVYIDDGDLFKTFFCEYKESCLTVRKRPQGLLGVQDWSIDTRLSEHAKDAPLRAMYPNSPVTSDEEAHWNTESSLFSLEVL
jgi:hypothetical protein